MKLRFTPRATQDLADIADYILAHNPNAAQRVRDASRREKDLDCFGARAPRNDETTISDSNMSNSLLAVVARLDRATQYAEMSKLH